MLAVQKNLELSPDIPEAGSAGIGEAVSFAAVRPALDDSADQGFGPQEAGARIG